MRLRNLKNSKDIIKNSSLFISEPKIYKGKWDKLFNNNNPIHIEIGMGKGKFIIENAIKNPKINFIGIERYDTLIAKAIRNIEIDIPNLKFVNIDASNLENIFDKEISIIYLNFSDPWPKDRHVKRRLTNEIFLKIYDNLFINNKKIIMKTDNRKLFEYSILSLSNYGYIINYINLDLHNGECEEITTEYEDKFVDKGNTIYKLECSK